MEIKPERVEEVRQAARMPLSLETPIGDADGDLTRGDLVADDKAAEVISQNAEQAQLANKVKGVLDSLDYRERKVLERRYGFEGGRQQTLEEVGKAFGVTRERIRQIEQDALAKLRLPKIREKLIGYLD